MFTVKTEQALNAAADQISADCSTEDLPEMVIDAKRLTMFGFPEADVEIAKLIGEHGYVKVLDEVGEVLG